MSEFSLSSPDFEEGGEIPKRCGYKHGNMRPEINFDNFPENANAIGIIMDDPDAMGAVGKVWVHWLKCLSAVNDEEDTLPALIGKNDFGELGYGGPAPPDKRHTYIFKVYALDTMPDLEQGYSKQELEDAMKGHIIAEAKLTGTFAP